VTRRGLFRRAALSYLDDAGGGVAGPRARAGYSFAERCLASFLRVGLPPRAVPAAAPTVPIVQAAARPGSPWFSLPVLQPASAVALAAASAERVAAALSPNGSVEFSLYRDEDGEGSESYSLEVVLRAGAELPGIVRVSYQPPGATVPAVLLVPVAAASLGPPASQVALPGFVPGTVWEGSGLMPLNEVPGVTAGVIEASVAAAASEATLAAWRQLAAGEGDLAALISHHVS
jgi:hypothetical protein